jgi:hypothetical protein
MHLTDEQADEIQEAADRDLARLLSIELAQPLMNEFRRRLLWDALRNLLRRRRVAATPLFAPRQEELSL